MTGTRRLTTCTANSTTCLCSSWVSVADSPVILHAALVRADADRATVHHLDEIHVGASRLEGLVIADLVTESDYLGRGYVMDEIDEVWDSGIDGMAFQGHHDGARLGRRRQVRLAPPLRRGVQADV